MSPRRYRSVTRAAATEQTHRRIVAAAVALLRNIGAAAFSLESVARKAGVTRLTVYNRFGSRRALLEAVFDHKAEEGGLFRLRKAMAHEDPRYALMRLIHVFCDFWSNDHEMLAGLYSATSGDAQLQASLRERNERRRNAIAVCLARMVKRNEISEDAKADLTDLIFVLTSFHVFEELTAGGRTRDEACALIQATVEDATSGMPLSARSSTGRHRPGGGTP